MYCFTTKYGEYYIRSGVNDLMKNLDIRKFSK